MRLLLLIFEVILILKITANVESQFMPPQMGGMQFPQLPSMPQMPQMAMNGAPPMQMGPMPPSMPMPMPMSFISQPKMPMVMMPYHSKHQDQIQGNGKKSKRDKKDKRKKKKKKKYVPTYSSSDESDSSSSESSDVSDTRFRSMKKSLKKSMRSKKNKKRRQVLTPVISYVTKDGYVVYQKRIKKDKAKDWLEMGNRSPNRQDGSGEKLSSSEEILRKVLRKQIDKVRARKS